MSTWRLFPTDGLFEAGDVFLSFPGETQHGSSSQRDDNLMRAK